MLIKNRVILASAGSGKTHGICEDAKKCTLATHKRILLISYTNKGKLALETEYKKQNSGVINKNVDIKTWYQFLLRDIIKPYQYSYLAKRHVNQQINFVRSIDYSQTYGHVNYNKKGTFQYFFNSNGDLKQNQVADFAIQVNSDSEGAPITRLEQIYDAVYVDEVQDLVGTDREVLELLISSKLYTYFVGDYKQATFQTHNTRKNKKSTGEHIFDYFRMLEAKGIVQLTHSNKSKRFNDKIAAFANLVYPTDEDSVESVMHEASGHDGVFMVDTKDLQAYCTAYHPQILVYDHRALNKCGGYQAMNFGLSKGLTFDHVLIVANGPIKKFFKGIPFDSPVKYYIAVTRARYSIGILIDSAKKYGETSSEVDIWENE